jgi:hypothetical protein
LGVSNGYLGEVQDVQMDTIFWMVGNTQYACTYHRHGSKLKNLPESPTSCSATSTTFMGWTDAPIQGQVAEAPMVLYDQAADFPAISSHMRYYAVFAEEIRSEVTSETITLSKTDSTNWTLTKLKQTKNNTDGAYWLLVKEASITSPVIDLQTLDSIAMIIRSYQSKKTVSFSADGVNLGKVVAATNTMQRYVWNAPELEGNTTLTFTGEDATEAYGAGVKEVTIYIGGQRGTYTNYLTHCASGPATLLTTTTNANHAVRKIIHNGQLLIIHNGKIYNTLGNNIELR